MPNFLDTAKATTATTGTGTVTLGSAVAGFRSWSLTGAVDGKVFESESDTSVDVISLQSYFAIEAVG
jgi:hypothetical protein